MQYCYNLESTTDAEKNIFGVCIGQEEPYEDGEIITFNSHVYKAYRSVQNMFKALDTSQFLGDPAGAFQLNPTENITWDITSLEYNGVEMLTSTISIVKGIADYQNFKADLEGYNFYQAPWSSLDVKNTTLFISELNIVFNSLGIPINAIMQTSSGMERICLLMREMDSINIVIQKTYLTLVYEYEFGVNYGSSEISFGIDGNFYTSSFEDSTKTTYGYRTSEECPCSRGAHNYSLTSCNPDEYPSINICSLTQLFYLNPIVYLMVNPNQYYQIAYLGQNALICEEFYNQDDIGQTNYADCDEANALEYFEVKNCATGKGSIFGFEQGELTPLVEPCGECPAGLTYNEETGFCEGLIEIAAGIINPPLPCEKGNISIDYGWGGSLFYPNISFLPKPLTETATPYRFLDGLGNEIDWVNYRDDSDWRNDTGSNGRMNISGIKVVGGTVGDYYGFSQCITVEEVEKIVCIGLGADQSCRVKINSEIVILMELGADDGSNTHWRVFPITLQHGLNLIEMEYKKSPNTIQSFGAEIYDAIPSEIYSWTSLTDINTHLIFSTKNMIGQPMNGKIEGWHCPEGYSINNCSFGDVPVCTKIIREESISCTFPVIKVQQHPCDCFEVIKQTTNIGELVALIDEYEDCKECLEVVGNCGHSERTIAYSVIVKLPEPPEPDRGFKECCYDNLVLASLSDDKYHKNDFNSFYFKKQLPSDECNFVLIEVATGDEYALDDGTYGEFWDFGDFQTQLDLTVYKVLWKKVLQVLGSGLYQIKKEIIISGIIFTEYSNTYNLEQFTTERADKTVRLDTVMDGKLVHLDVDFKGTGFTTSLRTIGYFGNRNPEYTQDNLVKRNYDTIQISMSQENEYQYQTGLLPVCITEQIYDFMLFGNKLYMNDYNIANHSYQYNKFPVELAGNKGAKYLVNNRDSRINLTFTDREKDRRKLNC